MESDVSLENVEAFLRLLAHDVRNDLSAIDLLATYLQEILPQGEAQEELGQLKASVRFAAQRMVRLSKALQAPIPERVEYPLAELLEDWRASWEAGVSNREAFSVELDWRVPTDRSPVVVDGLLVFEALGELLENACFFGLPQSRVTIAEGSASGEIMILQQTHDASVLEMEARQWRPFESSRRGRYGLGLFRARRILESFDAELRFCKGDGSHDSHLLTVVRFQLASDGGGGQS